MHEPHLILVGGGLLSLPAVAAARGLGLRVIVIDRDPWAPAMRGADVPIVASTRDVPLAVARARAAAARHRVAGVTACGADVEVTVAAIAAALGLRGPSCDAALRCNDKTLGRAALAAAGVPQPRFAEARSPVAAARAAARLGLPLVVKPIDNCGSRGVRRVDAPAQLPAAFADAVACSRRPAALLEQHVEGTTHTVEMLGIGGELHAVSIIDTFHAGAPFFVETGHDNPTARAAEERAAMVRVARAAARAAGMTDGPAKVDLILGRDGPVVLEMTARLSGGFHCQATTPLATGVDHVRAAIAWATGAPLSPADLAPRRARYAVCRALLPPPGVVVSVAGVEAARAVPGVAEVHVLVRPGDRIPPCRASADRRAFVIAEGATPADAAAAAGQAAARLRIETVPAGHARAALWTFAEAA